MVETGYSGVTELKQTFHEQKIPFRGTVTKLIYKNDSGKIYQIKVTKSGFEITQK